MAKRDKSLNRSFTIDRSKVDTKERTVELAFSSEQPVERWGENEVLSHEKGEYDFSRVSAGDHPLLLGHAEHDPLSQIGVIESARVDGDKVGRAIVRFGNSKLASEIFQDVQDGIRKLVSVGYDRTGIVESQKSKEGLVTTRYRWMPTHIAIVPVPADTAVGIGRNRDEDSTTGICPTCGHAECEKCSESDQKITCCHCNESYDEDANHSKPVQVDSQTKTKADTAQTIMEPTVTVNETEIRNKANADAKAALAARRKELRTRGDSIIKDFPMAAEKVRSMIDEAVDTEEGIDSVSFRCLKEAGAIKPANPITLASLGCSEREADAYSFARAIQSCVSQNGGRGATIPDGFEGEIHQEMMKRNLGFEPSGFMVPADARISNRSLSRAERRRMSRDLQVGIFGNGGATVATELITPIIELLRNRMVTERLGVRVMAGLEGNVVIPRQTGAGTAYAVSEIAALTASTQTLDQIPVSPKRVGTQGVYSKQLVLQSSIDVESFMRDDFLKVLAIMWDRLILNGQGAASEPLGILATPGIGSVLFGAAATYAKLVSFHTQVATANADVGEMAYVTTPSAEGVLRAAAKLLVGATTVAAMPLWDGPFGADSPDGIIAGYRAASTNQMPNDRMLFGVFSEVIHCLWGGYDIVVDPFTKAGNGEVVLTVNTWGDVAIRHPQCFAASSDSAAQ
jgi:HK97 family phage major capsid protein